MCSLWPGGAVRAAAAHRFLSCLRSYRDRHAWTTDPEPAREQNQPAGLFVNGNRKLHGANQDSPDAADADTALSPGEPDRKDADPAMRAELDGCDRVQLSASRSIEARPDSVSPKPELELADRAAAGCVELVRVIDG
jgi:hypothetical protein